MARLTLLQAANDRDLALVRVLFREYQQSLGIDLGFQGFEQELRTLPGSYAPPGGRLYLGVEDGVAACCAALQPRDAVTGEMKRLFVRPAFQGRGYGQLLARTIIADARAIGCERLVLDTLPDMTRAQAMYEALGFRDIPPYRANPVPGARFMALDLRALP